MKIMFLSLFVLAGCQSYVAVDDFKIYKRSDGNYDVCTDDEGCLILTREDIHRLLPQAERKLK